LAPQLFLELQINFQQNPLTSLTDYTGELEDRNDQSVTRISDALTHREPMKY